MMLFLFDVISILLIFLDKRRYKSLFTPLICFMIAYLVLINLNNIVMAKFFDFFVVSNFSLCVILIFFLIASLISNFFACFVKKISSQFNAPIRNIKKYTKLQKNIIIVLFILGLAAYLLSLIINIKKFGFSNIKRTNNGILAHIAFLCQILAPVIIFALGKRKRILSYFLVGIVLFIAIMYSQKYVLFINTIYFVLYLAIGKNIKFRKILKWLVIFSLFALLIFLFAYGVVPSLNDNSTLTEHMVFAVKNFFMYLLSPIIANNYSTAHYLPNGVLIAFCMPINIIKALSGNNDYVSPVHEFVFEYTEHEYTNVSGIIGELTYCLGFAGALLYFGIVLTIIYLFYINLKNNGKYKMTTCFLMSILTFSFFCNFFTVSGVVMQLIYTFILETGIQLLNKKEKIGSSTRNYNVSNVKYNHRKKIH